jgi:hypothetical protein
VVREVSSGHQRPIGRGLVRLSFARRAGRRGRIDALVEAAAALSEAPDGTGTEAVADCPSIDGGEHD